MKSSRMGRVPMTRRLAAVVVTALAVSTASSSVSHAAPAATKTGGEAIIGINEAFAGFCFTALVAGPAVSASSTINEALFTRTTAGEAIGLLASGATSTADFKTWTITLRPGISYTNGQAFNADSVIENLDYMRGAKYKFPITNAWTLGGQVTSLANVIAVRKVDDLTLAVDLFRPQNDFPESIAFPTFSMRASAQLASATTCASTPIGTGPYIWQSSSNSELVVTKNPNYWRTDPTKPNVKLPYLDKLSFIVVSEASQRAAAVRTKTIDAALFSGGSDNTFIKDLSQRKSLVKVYKTPVRYYPSIWLNQGNGGPFSDLNARLAVVNCVDRANFNKVRLKGGGVVPTSAVGTANVMYNKAGFTPFNVTKSKGYVASYLAANPGKTKLEFTMPVDPSTQNQNNAKFLQTTFAACGITMNILTEAQPVWLSKALNALTGKNAYDAVYLGLITETGVSVNFPFLATNAFPADTTNPLKILRGTLGALFSLTKHTDTTIDDLLWQARAATTKTAEVAAYKAATKKIQEQGILTSTATFGWAYVTNNKSKLSAPGKVVIVKGKKTPPVIPAWIDWAGISKG